MNKLLTSIALIAVFVVFALGACTPAAPASEEVARPSNPGGPGQAVNLTGDAAHGAEVFKANCVVCHGDQGKGGVENIGSVDGTVPELNPIDPTLVSNDRKTFITNLDLFIEHGSAPEAEKEGTPTTYSMLAFGDTQTLTPQDIADVIAYVMQLNGK